MFVNLTTLKWSLLFFAALVLFLSSKSSANTEQAPWKLWREQNNLSVSFVAVPNSQLIKIKAKNKITSSLSSALAFIQNTDHTSNWLANAKSSQVLKQISPHRRIFITHFDGLWPVKPRYMLLTSHYWQNYDLSIEVDLSDTQSDELSLITSITEPMLEPIKATIAVSDEIKVDVLQARWLIKPIDDNSLSIEYIFIADANGKLPRSFINKLALRAIWQSFTKMNEQLPMEKYQQYKVSGIKEAVN